MPGDCIDTFVVYTKHEATCKLPSSTVQYEGAFVAHVRFWRKSISPATDKNIAGDDITSVDPFPSRVGLQSVLHDKTLVLATHSVFLY